MNPRILNREAQLPADNWYEIEVPGRHLNRAAGVVQLLDAVAFAAIANRFAAEAGAPNFGGLLIDRDHFSLDPDKTSEALGWLKELRNRDGRLEGRIEWSDVGLAAVQGQRFKFFSTVYEPADCQPAGTAVVANRSYPLVRPLRLDRLALTNDPNNRGGKPISNREANPGAAAEKKPVVSTTMKSVLKLLGLADDASEDSAVAAVQKIQNRATTAEGQVTTLTKERDELLAAQVESDLGEFAPVIANRDEMKKQLLANRAGTLAVLRSLKQADKGGGEQRRITNRAAAATPGGNQGGSGNPTAAQMQCVDSLRVKNRCTFREAWNIAKQDKPELFAEPAK